jgi:hypothetical protein
METPNTSLRSLRALRLILHLKQWPTARKHFNYRASGRINRALLGEDVLNHPAEVCPGKGFRDEVGVQIDVGGGDPLLRVA